MKPTKGKAGKKLYVHHTIEIGSVIVHGCFCFSNILKIYTFSKFSTGRLCDWGILLVISLEFQGKKHQPFSMVQPPKLLSYEDSPRNRIKKLCLQYVVETLSRQKQLHPITETNISTIQYINHPIYQSYCMAGCIVSPVSESNHIEGAACSFLTEYIPPNHASP